MSRFWLLVCFTIAALGLVKGVFGQEYQGWAFEANYSHSPLSTVTLPEGASALTIVCHDYPLWISVQVDADPLRIARNASTAYTVPTLEPWVTIGPSPDPLWPELHTLTVNYSRFLTGWVCLGSWEPWQIAVLSTEGGGVYDLRQFGPWAHVGHPAQWATGQRLWVEGK